MDRHACFLNHPYHHHHHQSHWVRATPVFACGFLFSRAPADGRCTRRSDVGQTSHGAPVAILPETRGALSEDGAGAGPPPQRSVGGGAERGGGASSARWPTGTEDSPPGTQPAALREPGLQLVVEHAACPCSSGVPPLPALAATALWTTSLCSSSLHRRCWRGSRRPWR